MPAGIGHSPLLIPKYELMPRSISTPRSQPMSNYPPCSSLVSQPSPHLCHNQAPDLAKILIDPLVSAETPILTHRLCTTSIDGNKAATFYPFNPVHLGDQKLTISDRSFPIISFHFICYPLFSPVPVSTPLTLTIPICVTLGHVIFWFGLLFICVLASIKVTPFLRVSYSCHETSKSTTLDRNKICSDGVK